MMITAIKSSMSEYTSTSNDYKMNTSASKSTLLESTIKHLMNETRSVRRSEPNLESIGHNIRVKIPLIEKFTLK